MQNNNIEKQLPDVFKELQESRRRQAVQLKEQKLGKKNNKKIQKNNVKKKENISEKKYHQTYEENILYDSFQVNNEEEIIDHKFNAVGAIIGILFVILFTTTVKSNYIFATSKEEEKVPIGTFEENENPIDLMGYISTNISEVTKKEVVTESVIIEREVEYIENNQMPKDEQKTIEEGKDGNKEITYIRSYENENLIDEKIISENILEEPSKAVIEVGTSEFLADKKVHIGDIIYTIEQTELFELADSNSNKLCNVYQYIDLKLEEVSGDFCKIIVDGIEGYVRQSAVTSSNINPEIVEKNRIKRISLSLKFDMEINKPSGLSKEDFIKVLSGNIKDTNKIFGDNAGLFYEIEQKYNINGIFLASIGIHESNWGNSTIAKDKKNLFGYGAYDSSPYTSSVTFESYEYGIELVAKVLSKYYINEPGKDIYDGEKAVGSYYNGPTISGVNVRYASDQNWSNRVYSIMRELYEKLEK